MKRRVFYLILLSALFSTQFIGAQDNIDNKSAVGSWLGKIPVGAISLRIIFNITLTGKDSLAVTLDSPDQGAKNIKIGPVTLSGKEINIKAPMLLGEYKGTMTNDTLISGTWKQAGNTTPLDLVKQKAPFVLNRPQEPKSPFPYMSEDVTFKNEKGGFELAGTLTIPKGNGPFPAVVLITGSGSQNRNEELLGHKPFLIIADYLTRNGIAVLRYDDRGVGQSKGSPLNATSADFATDAGAAFLYLTSRKEINPKSIGFAGHSEGGLIAPVVASGNSNIAFIISLAGPGVNGEEIMNTQNMDISLISGVKIKDIKEGIAINKKLFAVLKKETDNKIAQEKIVEVYSKALTKKKTPSEDIDKAVKQLNASMNPVSYNWFRYFLTANPVDFWKKTRCPVLALNGEKDLQVSAKVNLPAIEKAVRSGGNQSVKTISLPDLNHLFQHCKTGLPKEYGEIEETFSPEVLKIMTDWILAL
ncbi:MAG: alpha/beta hydrolase [Bacteroidia bacterium]|nr:alpha/beta hydrolase [Bacteroidia bacterium]